MNQDFLASMSNGDKALAGGSIVVLIAMFLPWYGWDSGYFSASIDGFNSWGWLTFLGLLAVVAYFVIRNFLTESVKLPEMPVTDAQAYMIGGGVEVLGVVLFWLVSHQEGVLLGNLGVRFGLFVALIGGIATVAGGYLKQSEPAVARTAGPSTGTGAGASYPSAPPPPAAPPSEPPPSQPPAV